FNFQENRIFMHPKTMTAANHYRNVTGQQLMARDQFLRIVINVNVTMAAADDHNFGSAGETSFERTMEMALDFAPSCADDITHLLLKFGRGKKRRLRWFDFASNDVGQRLSVR